MHFHVGTFLHFDVDINNMYIYNKTNHSQIQYFHENLIPILSDTYGLILYKEQIVEMFHSLAGFSLEQSEEALRNMKSNSRIRESHSRNKEMLETFVYGKEEKNIPGCINKGIEEGKAIQIFEEILIVRNSIFLKAHAVSYMTIAYRTAYMRYYYDF